MRKFRLGAESSHGAARGLRGWSSWQGRLTAAVVVMAICGVSLWTAGVVLTRPPMPTSSPSASPSPANTPFSSSDFAIVAPGESMPIQGWLPSDWPEQTPIPTPKPSSAPRPAATVEPSIDWHDSPGHHLHVSGRVTDLAGKPIAGIAAVANNSDGGGNAAFTNAQGDYSVEVWSGAVKMEFDDDYGTYATGFLGANGFTYDMSEAIEIDMTHGDVGGVNIALPPALLATISFTDLNGTPVSGISCLVDVEYGISPFLNKPCTRVVRPGMWVAFQFWDNSDRYAAGYYNVDLGYTSRSDQRSRVTISTSSLNVTVALPPMVHISGHVSMAGGGILPAHLVVTACNIEARRCYALGSVPDANGAYSLEVGPGTWWVGLGDSSTSKMLGYYSSSGFTTNPAEATSIVVGSSNVTGIDMILPS